jgi:hypothetical protein
VARKSGQFQKIKKIPEGRKAHKGGGSENQKIRKADVKVQQTQKIRKLP